MTSTTTTTTTTTTTQPTTTPESTSSKEEITTVSSQNGNDSSNTTEAILYGDANCDNEVSVADAVLIMQSLANPNKFGLEGTDENHITAQGQLNGDVDTKIKGITSNDALRIQEYLLEKISTLDPEAK